ncbi:MAG: hypothetical protein HOP23_07465 [Methylococcaceae bacterium]|nr:hypothetical protein [Methylococcaceae bacterium]
MKKYIFLILIAGLAVLILFQQKVIMPIVLDVVKSDAFLVENKDLASQLPVSTSLTNFAFIHCNDYIKSELGSDITVTFADKPLNIWTLGNYHYVVNAEITVSDNNADTSTKKYACRIDYKNGDNEEGSSDFNNWSIEGVDGIN